MQQQRRRSRIILGLVALGLLAGVALTAHPAQAVDAIGPYYAEPAWDRKMAPVNRFVVLTDWNSEAVLDKETGLVWERSPKGVFTIWAAALRACTTKTTGNRKGWRLPSMPELASLIQPSGFTSPGPALPPGHPFLNVLFILSANYWSATQDADLLANAWGVNFLIGRVSNSTKDLGLQVWCVRGGNNAEVY